MSEDGRYLSALKWTFKQPSVRNVFVGSFTAVFLLILGALIASPSFLTDRAWWAWNGWPAITAMAQVLLVGTLAILWLQLRQLRNQATQESRNRRDDLDRDRQQRREEFERAHTPVLSVVLTHAEASAERGTATLTLVAVGQGVVHNVVVSFWTGVTRSRHSEVRMMPSIIAPSRDEINVSWDTWKETQQCTVEVKGFGTFWQPIDFQQHGKIEPRRLLEFETSAERL